MRRADERGFTLIEVIVVLAVLGLVGGLVLSRGPQRSATLELRSSVSTVMGAMRLARTRSIATNRPVPVFLDQAGARVTVEGMAPRALPQGATVAASVPAGEPAGRITFLPDGSATGGTVLLRIAGRSAQLRVDWLGGRVSVDEARRDAP